MSRSSNHTTKTLLGGVKRCLLSALTAALGVGILTTAGHAAGYVYQQHIVNAGVLVTGTAPAPYLFYVLNNRPDVKPTDITLINPLAPTTVTAAILNRWTPPSPATAPYTLNQAVTPDMAAYWEVPLNSASDSELAQFNVLYLRADGIRFGPAVNEKLRRFVDNGGQLIVEYGTSSTAVAPGLFIGTTQVTGTAGGVVILPQIGGGPSSLRHPIVSQPYFLPAQRNAVSGLQVVSGLTSPAYCLSVNTTDLVHSGEVGNIFNPVLTDTSGTVVSAAQIGAGQVIVSALNMGVVAGGGNGAYFLPQPAPADTAQLPKFQQLYPGACG